MKILMVAVVTAFVLSACAWQKPDITVDKRVTVFVTGMNRDPNDFQNPYFPFPVYINIEYTTKSEVDSEAGIDQDIKPDTTITPGTSGF